MESLPSGLLMQFNSDTLVAVRREYNLDKPGRMNEALDLLEDWVKKQNHFTKKDFSREYLERTLISTKGMMERAKTRIDRLCTFKTLMPSFFEVDVEKTYTELKDIAVHAHMPKLTHDHYRVHLFRLISDDGDSSVIFSYYKYLLVLSEYMKIHDYCTGFIIVMDFSQVPIMNFVTKLNVVQFRQALTILMEGYGMRIKGIHFITPSKMVDALVSIFKSVLSEKVGNRIHVHKTVETLYKHVQKELLPEEYGGKERTLKQLNEEWYKVVSSKEHQDYLQEMNQAKTIESSRKADQFIENYIGMPGSFRSLSVD